jgi:hypothetical protein
MFGRIRVTLLAAMAAGALLAVGASAAHADLLSVLPASCGSQPESLPFAPWGDFNAYTPVAGGTFESGSPGWTLEGGAKVAAGNESYYVSGPGFHMLSLPAGSSALTPTSCTSIYHPTVRFFVRNTGSASSRLNVQAVYPTLLGTATTTVGQISGSSTWQPSPALSLLVSNLLATVSLNETTIAFRFVPADSSGSWAIDDVYLDPFLRG